MGLWSNQVAIVLKIHWFYVKLKPIVALVALLSSLLVGVVISIMKGSEVTPTDVKKNGILLLYVATVPVFVLVLGMVAECKRSKLFLSLRRLGIMESAFWTSNAIIALGVSWVNAFLGALVFKLGFIPMYDFFGRIDYFVLVLMQATINMAMAFLAILVSTFFSDYHVTAIETAAVYITALPEINRNMADTGLCSLSCEYVEQTFFTSLWKNLIWPAYSWSNSWFDILSLADPRPEVKVADASFSFADMFISVFSKMDKNYLIARIAKGYGKLKYETDLLGFATVFGRLAFMWCYIPILFILAWYLHQVIDYQGYKLPYIFPFTKQYWRKVDRESLEGTSSNNIELKDISKEYGTKIGKAVDGFSTVLEPGNVYTILGHNGAGKTTLIGMLTGSVKPTGGDATIFGFDIRREVAQYLYLTGFCSQEDILVPNMTPYEHIAVFAGVRGVDMSPYGTFENYCVQLLTKVQLEHVMHQRADQFSGGMQRRLSFILSTIGKNKVYYLDEPTTGLDPISRGYIWDVIQDMKKESIVVLTSHNMQEADYLADKILVMVKGKLIAQGSSISLKNTFANEYQLRLTPKNELQEFHGIENVSPWAVSNLPGAFHILSTDRVVTVGVPRRYVDRLSDFLAVVEKEDELRWSVGDSSLEELFLRISAEGFNAEEYKRTQQEQTDEQPASTLPIVGFREYLEKENLTVKVENIVKSKVNENKTYNRIASAFKAQFNAQTYKIYQFLVNDTFANAIFVIFTVWQVGFNISKMEASEPGQSDDKGNFHPDPKYTESPEFLKEIWLNTFGTFLNGTRIAHCYLFFYFRYGALLVAERANGLLEVQEIQGMSKFTYWLAVYANGMLLNGTWILIWGIVLGIFSYFILTPIYLLDIVIACHAAVCLSVLAVGLLQKSQNVILIWLSLYLTLQYFANLPTVLSIFPLFGVFNIFNGRGEDQPIYFTPRFLTIIGSFLVFFIGVFAADFDYIMLKLRSRTSKPSKKHLQAADNKVQMEKETREASIVAEEQKIDELENAGEYPSAEALRLVHLKKVYGSKVAVNNLSLRINKNETFGIIGPNGAGKSTTFKMIYNAEKPTSGTVYIDSKLNNHNYVGVCPQKDIFWDYLTVTEHLKFYSLMNGVPESELDEWVKYICRLTLLQKEIHNAIPFMLSGGMKRRLSIAISMVGKREAIILDEPSAGLDPGTRIKLWYTIEQLRTDDAKSVVLTTHLMEEAEALCDRIGIINHGKLVALGTSTELKLLYGNMLKLNLLVIVKKQDEVDLAVSCQQKIAQLTEVTRSELNSNARLVRESLAPRQNGNECHMYLQYGIIKDNTSNMIEILKKVDDFCARNEITEFAFSETTLDEVFLYVMANLK